MFEDELISFNAFLKEQDFIGGDSVKEIIDDVYLCFFEAITLNVYQYYTPVVGGYQRTFQLIKAISYHVENSTLYMYVDTSKLKYVSNVNGSDVSDYVPLFVDKAHNDSTNFFNQYHHYEERNFLEKAKELIERKLGMEVEIVVP